MRPYDLLTPDIVKSVRQRWLLTHWVRLRGPRPMPAWAELRIEELDTCFDDMTFLELAANGDGKRLRIVTHGKNIGSMYAGQCAGKFLEDTLPEATRAGIMETYAEAIARRQPVYTVSCVADAAGRTVLYERLLLPFGLHETVTHVAAFLETISADGAFERAKLLSDAKAASAYRVKALLRTDGMALRGERSAART